MKNSHLIIYNGYPISVVIAVTFHSVVLAAMLYLQSNRGPEALELIQPTVIKALLLDENPQTRNEQTLERQRLQQIDDQRRQREQDTRQKELERQRQEALRQQEIEQQRDADAASAEEQRQAQLRRVQELEERQRREKEQRELEQEQQQRLQEQAEAQQRQEDAERQRESDAAASADVARSEFELVQSATGLIQQIVQENWSRPPSARNGMRVVIRMQMLPTGEVTDVSILQSSGDPAFDRAAETAVFRAAPFTQLQALPIKLFNQNFRTLSLVFQPEDLLN